MASKKYLIEFSKRAQKDFAKLDKPVQRFIFGKLIELEKMENPLEKAARLVNREGIYRFRFGDYRLMFAVDKQGKMVILVILRVAHRKDIYDL